MRFGFALLWLGLLPVAGQTPVPRELRDPSQNLAPFIASPQPIVDRMLDLAAIKPGESVFDLGCGDGRVLITAAQRFKAKGIGVELSPKLVKMSNEMIRRMNLESEVTIRQGSLLDMDLQPADVVILYLDTVSNDMLRPKLEKQLKPGARVVSHDFEVRGWKPAKVEKMKAYNRTHTIFLYLMPVKK
ncbi:MAG TPA: methyltransferase domain-containing protein [Bryobacteraceae bacterium]|nr:methyltransferase domain-containing protein [Bryobacteraceae bacterium]